jgi:hypothetical protein
LKHHQSDIPPHDFPPEANRERPKIVPLPTSQSNEPKVQPEALDWMALSTSEPPPRKWAIKGWLGYGHVTLLIGSGGIGKTLIAQQMGSCLAIGRSPFVDEIPEQAKVLMWACEDDHDELWRRQIAISRWLRTGIESFGDLVLVPRIGCDNQICVSEFGKIAFTGNLLTLKEQANDLMAKVVILDNVAQIYGASENDRPSVTAFINALCGALPGTAILLLGHPSRGLNSEFSGSSAWENVARTRMYLGSNLPDVKQEDDPSDNVRYLAKRKGNYSAKDWRRCLFKDGVLLPEEAAEPGGIVSTLRASKAERVVLDGMRKLADLGIYPTDSATSPRYLPRALGEYSLNDGMNRNELAAAMRRLVMDGKVQRSQVGKTANRSPVWGLIAKPE